MIFMHLVQWQRVCNGKTRYFNGKARRINGKAENVHVNNSV